MRGCSHHVVNYWTWETDFLFLVPCSQTMAVGYMHKNYCCLNAETVWMFPQTYGFAASLCLKYSANQLLLNKCLVKHWICLNRAYISVIYFKLNGPSTMLTFAMNGLLVFRAPLKTIKLAPVTKKKNNKWTLRTQEKKQFFRFMRQLLKLSSKCEDHIFINFDFKNLVLQSYTCPEQQVSWYSPHKYIPQSVS